MAEHDAAAARSPRLLRLIHGGATTESLPATGSYAAAAAAIVAGARRRARELEDEAGRLWLFADGVEAAVAAVPVAAT